MITNRLVSFTAILVSRSTTQLIVGYSCTLNIVTQYNTHTKVQSTKDVVPSYR